MPTIPPGTLFSTAGRVIGYLGPQLGKSEWDLLRDSLVKALELQLASETETTQLRKSQSKVVQVTVRCGRNLWRRLGEPDGTREVRHENKERRARSGPVHDVADVLITRLRQAVSSPAAEKPGPPERWSASLQGYLRDSALAGLRGEDDAGANAWRHVVCGGPEPAEVGDDSRLGQWVGAVAEELTFSWSRDERLEGFIDRIDFDTKYRLQQDLVHANEAIAKAVRNLTTLGVPLLLLGGGGVTLLILFVDKG